MSPSTRSSAILLAVVTLAALALCGCTAHADQTTTTMRWSSGLETRTLQVRGSVEFADDDRDVKEYLAWRFPVD